jgi:hypothetical protein
MHETDISMGLTCRINDLSPFTNTDMGRLRYTAQLYCQTDAELVRTYFGFLFWYDEGDNKRRSSCQRLPNVFGDTPRTEKPTSSTIGRRALQASNRNLSGLIGVRARAFSANMHWILCGLWQRNSAGTRGSINAERTVQSQSLHSCSASQRLMPTPPSSS